MDAEEGLKKNLKIRKKKKERGRYAPLQKPAPKPKTQGKRHSVEERFLNRIIRDLSRPACKVAPQHGETQKPKAGAELLEKSKMIERRPSGDGMSAGVKREAASAPRSMRLKHLVIAIRHSRSKNPGRSRRSDRAPLRITAHAKSTLSRKRKDVLELL